MKDIKDYINESYNSQKIEKALEDCAWGIIDEFNQEGVQGWEEQDIKKFVNGDEDPDFKVIVDAMIEELEEYGDKSHILQYLKKYDSDETWKESIDVAILKAMEDYVNNI